jgi:hypothetical protein
MRLSVIQDRRLYNKNLHRPCPFIQVDPALQPQFNLPKRRRVGVPAIKSLYFADVVFQNASLSSSRVLDARSELVASLLNVHRGKTLTADLVLFPRCCVRAL